MTLALTCSLGPVSFHGWNPARLPTLQNIGEDFSRLGQTGSGSQVLGKRARAETVTAWRLCSSMAEAQGYAKDCEALSWTVVTATDPLGNAYTRVRVMSATPTVRAGRGTDGATALLSCSFNVEVLP